ncbi:TrkA C-terminal domain-containing protein [Nocardioides sp. AE5]|uniref:TrkA C-terminal domain-containing protein n=1 Tax=Nocardioides sp. AE5 TaxID=2962573 RepID=UPI0028824381|nr:TrkA C-terminal domain-containing protein [Nocardioides sp. AE5]MDT0202464.1 TrkA C-terminal domain-containing protein [Nocardioides sp. AE5]
MGFGELELAISAGMICSALGFTVGLVVGRGRQPRWVEKGSFVHKVSIGFATLDRLDAVMLRFEVEPGSKLAGVEVGELRLPSGAAVALITRGSLVLVPTDPMALKVGDQVLVVSALGQVTAVEDRLRLVSQHGRLAGWHESVEQLHPPGFPTQAARTLGPRRQSA